MKPRTFLCCLVLLAVSFLWAGKITARAEAVPGLTTITNPTPVADDLFGSVVAAMGEDRVLVGAEGAREAYLFNQNGTLLATFPAPEPAASSFGAAVAAVGSDRLIIGAYNYLAGTPVSQVGRAYLYNTNGGLVATFTNPSPATVQAFGFSVAAVGSGHVLIGSGGGGPFLFRTNGALVTTFTKPGSGSFINFGNSIAGLGPDRVLIGGPTDNTGASGAGAAYLFRTNGTLLTTFTNPIPVANDNFGTSVAIVGTECVVISAIDFSGMKGTGGTAYLYTTNGMLLTTFTNPTPAAADYFGWSVAAVGNNRVLIGAYQDGTGAFQAGSAYLFSTNGALLNTFTNPAPASQEWFGWSVAGLGKDRVIIGAVWDNTGAMRAGSAYMYTLPYPALAISKNPGAVSMSWVTAETGLLLQESQQIGSGAAWVDATNSTMVAGTTNIVQQTISGSGSRFYRLRRP